MKRRLLAILLVIGCAASLDARQRRPLTLTQIRELVSIQTPDAALAREITDRGVDFPVEPRTLEGIRAVGAGPRTIAALSAHLAGTLLIVSAPSADVVVNGAPRGRTAADGRLSLSLAPGDYSVSVTKRGFFDGRFEATVKAGTTDELSAMLSPSSGALVVHVNRPDATIAVAGSGTQRGHTATFELLGGTHTLTVSAPGFETETRTVDVAPGMKADAAFTLKMDPAVAMPRLRDARDAITRQDYHRALSLAEWVIALDPEYAPALAVAVEAAFQVRPADDMGGQAARALDGGEPIRLGLLHHHAFGALLHEAGLVLTPRTFTLITQGEEACTLRLMAVPYAQIAEIDAGPNRSGEMYLQFKIRDAKNPKKTIEVKLAYPGSRLVVAEKGLGGVLSYRGRQLQSPQESAGALRFVRQLVERQSRNP